MNVSEAVKFCMRYHVANSKPSTIKNYEFVLGKLNNYFSDIPIESLKTEEVITFLTDLAGSNKVSTRRGRYAILSAFFNLTINTISPAMENPCSSPAVRKLFRRPKPQQWHIFDKNIIDEVIFRTTNQRNRLMLELMARGGMRISEVLNLEPQDLEEGKLLLRTPKSGRDIEVVFVPQKLNERLRGYIRDKAIQPNEKIFPISYTGARKVVSKVGQVVGIRLRPHDLRRHAATYASRAGVPVEIISKVILRHSNLSTTQQYLGKVSDLEAMRWIENLHG